MAKKTKLTLGDVWQKHKATGSLTDKELVFLLRQLDALEKSMALLGTEFAVIQRYLALEVAVLRDFAFHRKIEWKKPYPIPVIWS